MKHSLSQEKQKKDSRPLVWVSDYSPGKHSFLRCSTEHLM